MQTIDNTELTVISQMLENNPESVSILNKSAISAKPLPEDFIEAHANALDWRIVSNCQPLTPHLINKFAHLIDFIELAFNTNLPAESIEASIDRMDFTTSQHYNKYTPEMIKKWLNILDVDIIIKYQTLDEDTMGMLLSDDIVNERWMLVKNKIDTMIYYQKLSVGFIMSLIMLEKDNIELVDRNLLIKHQELPEFFIEKFILKDLDFAELVFKYQKITDSMILAYIDHVSTEAAMNQEMSEKTMCVVLDKARTDLKTFKKTLVKLCEKQQFGSGFLDEINLIVQVPSSDNIQCDEELCSDNLRTDKDFMRTLYTKLFMRTLDPEDPNWINWDIKTVNECIIPFISWTYIVKQRFTEKQIDSLIEITKSSDYKHDISWYVLLRHNVFTQKQIETAMKYEFIGAIEMWMVSNYENFDPEFTNSMQKYKNWWNFIKKDSIPKFAKACRDALEVSAKFDDQIDIEDLADTNSILLFIKDFIYYTNWTELLREQQLPEWFIWIFGKTSDRINRKLKGVDYWWKVSRYQKLSAEFIKFHINDLDLDTIMIYQNVPHEQIEDSWEFMNSDLRANAFKYQGFAPKSNDNYLTF